MGEASAADEAGTEAAGHRDSVEDETGTENGVGVAAAGGGDGGDDDDGAADVEVAAVAVAGPDPPHRRNWDSTCASASGTSPRSPA